MEDMPTISDRSWCDGPYTCLFLYVNVSLCIYKIRYITILYHVLLLHMFPLLPTKLPKWMKVIYKAGFPE